MRGAGEWSRPRMEHETGALKRPWDTCREVPIIEDEQTPWKLIKFLKSIALFLVALLVFALATCSKTSFLLLITLSHEGAKSLQAEQKPLPLLCVACVLIAPSVLLLLKSIWKACFKSSKVPRKGTVALVLFFEFLVSSGLAVLTIVAMPHFDFVTNVTILNAVAFLSVLLQAVAQCTARKFNRLLFPSVVAVISIPAGFCLFLVLYVMKDPADVQMATWVGLAVGGSILVSFNWWENYFRVVCVTGKPSVLKNLFEDMAKCQNVLHILSSLFRIAVTACVVGAYVPLSALEWSVLTAIPKRETKLVIITVGVQLVSSAFCQWFALVACKMHAVRRCFILPLYMASLAAVALLLAPVLIQYQEFKSKMNTTQNINFTQYCVDGRNQSLGGGWFPQLVWDLTQTLCLLDMSSIGDIGLLTGASVCWWLGFILATLHIWFLKIHRIQKTEDLFVRRHYEGALIEQSLLLNTRFNVTDKKNKNPQGATTAMVYLCATMWHETYEEMMNIMTSIFRLDQYRPKNSSQFDDFTFEAHIYFDDAFSDDGDSGERRLNSYAEDLVKIITEVYGIFKNLEKNFFAMQQQIPDQTIIKTPYGARLVVEMPYGNNLVVHFKDKKLIRNKKRWSQVMYLYYLLGWKLLTRYYNRKQNPGNNEKEETLQEEMQREKHNTYLLALDGDTDFQPAAVMLLIDRLRMYPRVGAACGRIHPTGSGPAVWFQKFEYAVSHWLQKTAEHVFGSVLCSPGCFSLFRAEALMDDNVMKKYSTKPTKASHHIQYDQGEDRWLCTLLLKQGWRVEYNAASDAYTNAPEDFKELYNQRKRWGPSTMANVVDLLGSTNTVSKRNPSISKLFMFYQLFAIISSVLGPATICLMVAGSLTFTLELDAAYALVIAVIPPIVYLGLCFKLKPDTQIKIAALLSIMYAILMLLVTMSIIGSMVEDQTILTPSSIFIIAMSIIYIVTALMHPQEFPLMFYGLLYIICIPSAYLLLTIYSMVNMNSVSWGTRETKTAADQTVGPKTRAQKAKSKFLHLFSWMKCCKKSKQKPEDMQPIVVQEVAEPQPQPRNSIVEDARPENERVQTHRVFSSSVECWKNQLEALSADIKLEDVPLQPDETNFWEELIKKYLEPLSMENQNQTKEELQDLRNKINFSFFFVNALWLISAFFFQVFDVFKIEIDLVDLNLVETEKKFQIEPMALMFILGFSVSVLLQFLGMFWHRVLTLIHYISFLETEPKLKTFVQDDSDSNSDSSSCLTSNTDLAGDTDSEGFCDDVEFDNESSQEFVV